MKELHVEQHVVQDGHDNFKVIKFQVSEALKDGSDKLLFESAAGLNQEDLEYYQDLFGKAEETRENEKFLQRVANAQKDALEKFVEQGKVQDFEIEQLKTQLDECQTALKSIRQIVNSGATGRGALLMEKDKIAELINALNL